MGLSAQVVAVPWKRVLFLTSNPAYLAFHKSARQGELLERFNKTLADMKRDGGLVAQEVGR